MSDAEQVAAEVVEDAISPLSKAELWLAGARERVAELAARYHVPESIETDREFKDIKSARSSVRRDASELDAQRKAMTREMEDALKAFRADVKGVLEPLTDLDAAYKALIDDYDARWGADRRQELQEAYDEYAPDLVPLVPLDRLVARYGSDKGKGWLNRSTNIEAAKAGLRGAIDSIAQCERTVEAAVDPDDAEAAKADYFATLDVGQAIANAQARSEQRERVRILEEERRRREEEYQRLMEQAEREKAEQQVDESRRPSVAPPITGEPRPVVPDTTVTPSEFEHMRAQTVPQADSDMQQAIIAGVGAPSPGNAPDYVVALYCDLRQANELVTFCQQRGITRYVKLPTHGRSYKLTPR